MQLQILIHRKDAESAVRRRPQSAAGRLIFHLPLSGPAISGMIDRILFINSRPPANENPQSFFGIFGSTHAPYKR
jgi:hypothetical protein